MVFMMKDFFKKFPGGGGGGGVMQDDNVFVYMIDVHYRLG